MSMIGTFRAASDSDIKALLEKPDMIQSYLYPDDDSEIDWSAEFDVDKAWHGIHFLLCNHPWEGEPPLNFIVGGGTPVGDIDVGYGPARVFTSGEVADIVRALDPITSAQLKKRYNASVFKKNKIYPMIWDEPESECLDGYVLENFENLKQYLQNASLNGKALIVYMT